MKGKHNLSIKTVFAVIIAISVVLATACLTCVGMFWKKVKQIRFNTLQYDACVKYASQLDNGTRQFMTDARNFAANHDYYYFVDYWKLKNVEKPRTNAIAEMKKLGITEEEDDYLETVLGISDKLIETEKVSLLCVLRSEGVTDVNGIMNKISKFPECEWIDEETCKDLLDTCLGSEWAKAFEGEDLSSYNSDQYASKAVSVLFSDEYNQNRQTITTGIEKFNESVTDRMENELNSSVNAISVMIVVVSSLFIVTLSFVIATLVTLHVLLVRPVLKIKRSIEEGNTISPIRMKELQALSNDYNKSKTDFSVTTKELELQMSIYREQSRRDYLTNLANREMLDEYLEGMFKGGTAPFILFMLDVDDFKLANDTYGHAAGDEVLKAIAKILKNVAFRYHGIAARYGGEEFVIIATGVTEDDAERIGAEILSAVSSKAVTFEGVNINVTVSVGSCYSLSCKDKDEVLQHADNALYKSKASGKNCHTAYLPYNGNALNPTYS